jgi:hypothetical protein
MAGFGTLAPGYDDENALLASLPDVGAPVPGPGPQVPPGLPMISQVLAHRRRHWLPPGAKMIGPARPGVGIPYDEISPGMPVVGTGIRG